MVRAMAAWAVALLLGWGGPAALGADKAPRVDLSAVSRTIDREPPYQGRPQYCLLVFGPRAESRVWLVWDGATLYVDRNGNGDLAEAGESLEATEYFELGDGPRHRQWTYNVGEIAPAEDGPRHTGFKVTVVKRLNKPAILNILGWVNGKLLQQTDKIPLFEPSAAEARIIHFGGPLIVRSSRGDLSLLKRFHDLHLCFGTPGLGKDTFAYVSFYGVPNDVHPEVEIAWPTADPGMPDVRSKATLDARC